ncbi:MAG: tetratricopeptide repeat protein, partial [Pseudomonadota bacterium]
MKSFLSKIFGSAASSPVPALPERDAARCAELKKRGNALLSQGMLGEAGRAYRAATLADPQDAAAFVNLGYLLAQQNNWQEAEEALKQALLQDADQCDAHFMLGRRSYDKGNMAAAATHMREVLRIQPGFDLTNYFSGEDSNEDAMAICRMVLSIDPENALAHRSLGMTQLLLGDYENGWREYQWRFRVHVPGEAHKSFAQPIWLGESSISGKTILLHWEQGFGDTLQFCRYVREVAALGATVVLQVQVGLGNLLDNLEGAALVLEEGQPLPPFDVYCPLLSLPLALKQFSGEMVSGRDAYLHADPARVEHWKSRLDTLGLPHGARVGVVWSGNSVNLAGLKRSMPLAQFARALPHGCRVVGLQTEVWPGDVPTLAAESRIAFVGGELDNFAETAALISSLDLVITIDTSVAHLAGALGKPVWVLLHRVADWRWLLERDDSPWYPGARLFRQQV